MMPHSPTVRTVFKISIRGSGSREGQNDNDRFSDVRFGTTSQEFVAATVSGDLYLGNILEKRVTLIVRLGIPTSALEILTGVDTNLALVGLTNGHIVKIDLADKMVVQEHTGAGSIAQNISVHPFSPRVATAHGNGVVIWDVGHDTLQPLNRLNTVNGSLLVNAFFGLNGDEVVSCFDEGTIVTWTFPDLSYGSHILAPSGNFGVSCQLAVISGDCSTLAAIFDNTRLLVWNMAERRLIGQQELVPECHRPRRLGLLGFPNKLNIAWVVVLLCHEGRLRFLDADSEGPTRLSDASPPGAYVSFSVSTTGDALLTAITADDGSVEILNAKRLARPPSKSASRERKSLPQPQIEVPSSPVKTTKTDGVLDAPRIPPRIATDVAEMRKILDQFGQFPVQYRFTVWQTVLSLPGNAAAFSALMRRGTHPAFADLKARFPVVSGTLAGALQRMLSCLAHWCPLFAEVTYLPHLVMPFVVAYGGDHRLACFETVLSYLTNWCRDWFRFYPAPPLHVLARVEQMLRLSAPRLLEHLVERSVPATQFAWPLLESSFSDVLPRDDWLRVWDHIFASRSTDFLLALVASYAAVSENTLLRCMELREFRQFFANRNAVSVDSLLVKAYSILDQLAPARSMPFVYVPLPTDTYPVFVDFPADAVRDHAEHMVRIRALEHEYVDHRRSVLQLESEMGSLADQEREWKRREAVLRAAESLRRQEHNFAERQLHRQRLRLQTLNTELTEKELLVLESKKRSLLREHQLRKESDVARLEDAISWKTVLKDTEFREAEEEALVRNLRHQIDKCRLEIELLEREAGVVRPQSPTRASSEEQLRRSNDSFRKHGDWWPGHAGVDSYSYTKSRSLTSLPRSSSNKSKNGGGVIVNASGKRSRKLENSSPGSQSDLDEKLSKLATSNRNLEKDVNDLFEKLRSFKE